MDRLHRNLRHLAISCNILIVAAEWCCRRPKPSGEVRNEAARPLASSDDPESLEFKTSRHVPPT